MSRKTKISALPALPPNVDPQLKPILHAIKEALEVQVGHRGEQLDKAVTFRDLSDAGMAKFRFDNTTGGQLLPITNPGDQSTPPTPRSLAANGTFTNVILSWEGGFNHPLVAATEVFRNTTDNLLTASFIGATGAHIYVDTVEPGTTHYYWVRFRSPSGVLSPFNGTDGTSATTSKKVSDLISDLSDELNESHLSSVLSTKIDTIAINGTSISTEVSNRIAAITGEATARENAIGALAASVADITGAEAYDNTVTYATNALVTYTSKLYKASQSTTGNLPTNATYWTLVGNYSSIGAVVVANAGAVSVLDTRVTSAEGVNTSQASDITVLNSSVTNANTNVATNASAISGLDTRVTTTEGSITTNASDITALETTVNHGSTGVAATASGLSALQTTVTTQGTATTTNASDITALETTVNHGSTGVAATASGLSALQTTVTTQGTATTTNASDITALETTVNHGSTGVAATASGLSTLSTTVSTQGSAISSQASSITTLNTTVGENSASITDHTTSIDGISAEKYVKIDLNGNVSGYGIYAGASGSEFAVNADVFKISNGTNKVVPFGVVGGVTYINTALIADASIDVAKIGNLTVDMAQVTGVLTAAQVNSIVVTGNMIEAGALITSPTIYGGVITAGTAISSPVITGGVITGSLILSGSTGKVTELGGSHYGYDLGVTMDISASSTSATTRATGNIKPYNYGSVTPPSNGLQSPASNLWRYRRQNVTPSISGSVYITNVGGLINSNSIATQTHCTVTIRVLERVGGTLFATKAFNIQSFNSGDDETKTLNLTGSNGGFSFALSHQYRTETGSDGYTTYYYHRMVPNTMTFTASPATTVAFNDSASTGMVAEVVISSIATSYASVGTRAIRIQDNAENDY